jgi:hydroxymethylbilane synthase
MNSSLSPQSSVLSPSRPLRLGTRGSLLARTQSQWTADALLAAHPGLRVELVTISTSGDRLIDQSLADAGGKGLFTKELELALLAGEIDFAVHSMKDVPVTMPLVDQAGLVIAAIPAREDARDVLVSRHGRSLADLPAGSTVGTGSLRRRCQILAGRPDLRVVPLRGNVDTRLKKLEQGENAAIVLAMAGLQRLRRFDAAWMTPIEPVVMLPAAGQGALALQCRLGDELTTAVLAKLDDPATRLAVLAERAVVAGLDGDCHSPIAAWSIIEQGRLSLTAAVGRENGDPPVARAAATAGAGGWRTAVESVCRVLRG